MIPITRTQLGLIIAIVLAVGMLGGAVGKDTVVRLYGSFATDKAQSPASMEDSSAMAEMDQSGHEMSAMGNDQMEGPAMRDSSGREVAYWYDPMHPNYRSDKPGIAPDCGMQLVPRYQDELEALEQMAPGTVQISPEKQQLIGVRTATPQHRRLTRTLRTVGKVEMDETRLSRVHTKVDGWVEEVYGDYVGKLVRKGQPLFTLYSPKLVSTQEEYLLARRGEESLGGSSYANVAEGAQALLRAARERLRLWDISEEQIRHLEETGEIQRSLTIVAPVTGYVTERNVYPQTFVKPDMALYKIADLLKVWVRADLYEFEAPYVHPNQPATMQLTHATGRKFRGRVEYVYPMVNPETRTVQVRLEFRNPDLELKPEMLADVELKIDYGRHILIPAEAVLDSGMRQIVFVVHNGGYFEPRRVELGPRFDGQVAVLKGLELGETIVTSGNFLIDSESQLTAATGAPAHQHSEQQP